MKHFTSLTDIPSIDAFLQQARLYKQNPLIDRSLGKHKRIGLIFLNPSMRTRISAQIAAQNLGMECIVLNINEEGWAWEFEDVAMSGKKAEHIKDAAPILGAYFDLIGIRTFPSLQNKEEDRRDIFLRKLVEYANVPVLSLESAALHPLQSAADVLAIEDNWGKPEKPKVVLTWAPHIKPTPHCVANSFAQWIDGWGKADFVIAHPRGLELDEQHTQRATIEHDQRKALEDADFIYVKSWASYRDYGKLATPAEDWMLTLDKLAPAPQARVMHCLPVRRDVELGSDILDSPRSLATTQAHNRVCTAQAAISHLLKNN